MKSVLITGSNRGIGLGLLKQLLKSDKPPVHIVATCRNIEKAEELNDIASKNQNVSVLKLDVSQFEEYPNFVAKVDNILRDEGLNVLINNAGISSKFTRVGLVKVDQLMSNLITNTVAPIMLTKAFLPMLKKASSKNNEVPVGTSRAAVINISSILGSIEKNDKGGFYPYRCSKAALNAATKSLSIDLKDEKILVVSLHPGWCKTNLGGANAPMEVEEAVKGIIQTLGKLTQQDNGTFLQYDGSTLPW